MYDITNYSSFENLDDWLAAVTKVFSEEGSLPHIALVGNKCKWTHTALTLLCNYWSNVLLGDMEHMRTVRKERHVSFAKQFKMSR